MTTNIKKMNQKQLSDELKRIERTQKHLAEKQHQVTIRKIRVREYLDKNNLEKKMETCLACGEYYFNLMSSPHRCKPIFYFKHPDWGDEFEEIRARDFDDAAIEFAKKYDEDEHPLLSHDEEVIISDGNTEKRYNVSAEPDILYHAGEIEN